MLQKTNPKAAKSPSKLFALLHSTRAKIARFSDAAGHIRPHLSPIKLVFLKLHLFHVFPFYHVFITFLPKYYVGTWLIGILHREKHISGSPFECHVYNAALVKVLGLDVGLVGQDLKFTVDTAKAGLGTLRVRSKGF
jgi:hypothetical protein